ncbi:multiprotein-bridging factor 1 [Exophiala dermatitidis]|uniref:Multiprotein-bridging factor 1 n=2 Tax=Exophiala dermatitidis TaxID=5970 RepID=H6C2Q9_EXODN|nr:transcription factor [Exophiala dermatitidis NIH/UT8656]KAJ4508565.1 multiprotein-bridging factor 1 [Exophiala dermatitidis]EHY58783.1 transcription factor [Exophiala dermatitidis NIH/UT8656]KAJ4510483.1 multiprotein-bridging factor 1 [Exophiala dermatitidis]KAJ4510582.1 multiprotein-bridging factor 1 [Exophiala dermatitidis]KAJ4535095.1 multiprotein-bridging factor 1 [Exophiala dermatitidis]
MADNEWDSVTRIGSRVRAGGGAAERERVVKGRTALNAAQRSGAIVLTEKKYGGTNTKSNVEGQHATKVDRSDDIVPVKTVGKEVSLAIIKRRNEMQPKLTQKDLATKVNEPVSVIQALEKGDAQPNQQVLAKLERVLGVKLRGKGIGTPYGARKGN